MDDTSATKSTQKFVREKRKGKRKIRKSKKPIELLRKKNGDKTKKGKTLQAKKKHILNSIKNPVPTTISAMNGHMHCL